MQVKCFYLSLQCASIIADRLKTGRLEHISYLRCDVNITGRLEHMSYLRCDVNITGRLEHMSYLHCDVNITTAHPRVPRPQKSHRCTCRLKGILKIESDLVRLSNLNANSPTEPARGAVARRRRGQHPRAGGGGAGCARPAAGGLGAPPS
jgi:hypothetical protein